MHIYKIQFRIYNNYIFTLILQLKNRFINWKKVGKLTLTYNYVPILNNLLKSHNNVQILGIRIKNRQ